jgi:hypothetical protein
VESIQISISAKPHFLTSYGNSAAWLKKLQKMAKINVHVKV